MAALTSAVGLCLDMVGAVVLVFVLRKHSQPLLTGSLRTPEEYAHDLAIGCSGAALLIAGFAFQLAAAFGYHHYQSRENVIYDCLAAVPLGAVLAWIIFQTLKPPLQRREQRRREQQRRDAGM
jgi:hypothetical protein